MNIALSLLVLVVYVLVHAHKSGTSILEWIAANKMTVIVAGGLLIGVALLPKVITGTLVILYVLPLLNTWGIVSAVSNLFTVVEGWIKKLF